jgi:hypothetical protein
MQDPLAIIVHRVKVVIKGNRQSVVAFRFKIGITSILVPSFVWFIVCSIHWPLVGDAALMRYISFLMEHGRVPYLQIGDINLPGTYLLDWLVVHVLGASFFAWRIYDLFLVLTIGFAAYSLLQPAFWFAGVWSVVLFALIHGQDGLYQLGQRDLAMAVFVLSAVAILFRGIEERRSISFFLFGLNIGMATIIKPTGTLFLLLALPSLTDIRRNSGQVRTPLLAVAVGWCLPLLGSAAWLLHLGALGAFIRIESTLAPYHASLGRRSVGYLLQHSFSPILPLIGLWFLLKAGSIFSSRDNTPTSYWYRLRFYTLLIGALCGLIAYVAQGKGYPYQRYPFLLFVLILVGIDLDEFLGKGKTLAAAAAIILLASSLWLGVGSAFAASRFDWQSEDFTTTLEADLNALQSDIGRDSLSGSIQCIDSISGCVSTLNDMHLVQSTSLIYDEFLLHSPGPAAVDQTRVSFLKAIQANPPVAFVVTEWLFPDGPASYAKLAQWPDFNNWLNANYKIRIQRTSMKTVRQGGPAYRPSGYRIYELRSLPD